MPDNSEYSSGLTFLDKEFIPRQFVTVDARQMAFNNFDLIMVSQSGLAGGMFWQNMDGAENPNGFVYTTNVVGIGGTPSPAANGSLAPLIGDPNMALTFLLNGGGFL